MHKTESNPNLVAFSPNAQPLDTQKPIVDSTINTTKSTLSTAAPEKTVKSTGFCDKIKNLLSRCCAWFLGLFCCGSNSAETKPSSASNAVNSSQDTSPEASPTTSGSAETKPSSTPNAVNSSQDASSEASATTDAQTSKASRREIDNGGIGFGKEIK